MAVAGLVRLRRHLFGRQQVRGTKVAATHAYPFKGVPSVDLTWTDPDVDAGSIATVVAPFRGPGDYTASLTQESLTYNSLPQIFSGFFGGNVDGTGTPDVTWLFEPTTDGSDEFDYHTYEFGDDVLIDWYQLGDGIVENFEISGPVGLGALSSSVSWRFGSASSTGSTDSPVTGTVPTPSQTLDTGEAIVYLKDATIAVASTLAGLGAGVVSDALYSFTLRGTGDVDQKRWANGSQTYDIDEMVRASRSMELECRFAKTADTVGTGSESDAWFSDDAVNRYLRLTFTSTVDADTGTPYSWVFTMPARWYTRTEDAEGGNTVIVLTAHSFDDGAAGDVGGDFTTTVINTLTASELGSPGS